MRLEQRLQLLANIGAHWPLGLRVAALRSYRLQNIPQLLVHREPPLRLGLESIFQSQPLGADGDRLLEQDKVIVDVLPLKGVGPLGQSSTIAFKGWAPVETKN